MDIHTMDEEIRDYHNHILDFLTEIYFLMRTPLMQLEILDYLLVLVETLVSVLQALRIN